MSRIYLSPPHVMGDELAMVKEAIESNWVAPLGPHVDAFEAEFAETVKVTHAVALSSGTAALHLALRLIGIKPGDEVLCPTLTFVASANPILYESANPVFIDVDPDTWTVDPNLLERELAERAKTNRLPKAVITVDLYGQSADHDAVGALCDRFEIPVIEDAAEALGATYKGQPVGGFGRFGVFSFNGNKIITSSGGGMLVSNDAEMIDRARFLATQARDPAPHYQHSSLGYNYRMSNIVAAIGRAQLRSLGERVSARRASFDLYLDALAHLPGIEFMPEAPYGTASRWLTCITIDPQIAGVNREQVRMHLEDDDIEARPVWKPLHMQPLFDGCDRRGGEVAAALFASGLCLPSGSSLTSQDRRRVVSAIERAWGVAR
jgi:dTDP-4-amino-4,6-dideoxygalactose transaminase